MQTVPPEEVGSKTLPMHLDGVATLSRNDRHLLLRASLGLFLKRLNHNIPVFRDDIARLTDCADQRPTVPTEALT